MINQSLQLFCNRTVAAGRITDADVAELGRTFLPDGLTSREDADMLIALGRALPESHAGFGDLLTALVVDFAVWGERPTGYVDADVARWLAASLGAGSGPGALGARIALAVIREAQTSDEHFIAFALAARTARETTRTAQPAVALAA